MSSSSESLRDERRICRIGWSRFTMSLGRCGVGSAGRAASGQGRCQGPGEGVEVCRAVSCDELSELRGVTR